MAIEKTPEQLKLFFVERTKSSESSVASTFADNLSLPVHRWFRYPAGFSALWVRQLIEREKCAGRSRILDPFSGSGTSLLVSEHCSVDAIGIEAHPFVARVARAKLHWQQPHREFRDYALSILEEAGRNETEAIESSSTLIRNCFPPETLSRLEALRRAWSHREDASPLSELTWLALASILRQCSPVGTAQWQYILPAKTKAKVIDPYEAFRARVSLIANDMAERQREEGIAQAALYWDDARTCSSVLDGWADLVITSPPYANNYDYADATRLEMSFFGEINGWGDLQEAVRKYLVRSCTQHVTKWRKETYEMINDPLLGPIHDDLLKACQALEAEKDSHGGKKLYHTMIAAYFSDMARVWITLRRVTGPGALVCFVIGDSAPYGVHIPVDTWLGELALAAGFKSYTFEKTRDRNIKWKNRKHNVPLHEGRLWVEG